MHECRRPASGAGAAAAVVEPAVLCHGGRAGASEEEEALTLIVLDVISTDGGQQTLARAGQLVALGSPEPHGDVERVRGAQRALLATRRIRLVLGRELLCDDLRLKLLHVAFTYSYVLTYEYIQVRQ